MHLCGCAQVLCFITAGVSRIIPPQPPASFVFVSSVIIVCALLSLVLLFGPKLYFVVQHGGVAGTVTDDRRLAALEAHQRDEERRCLAIADENALLSREVTDVCPLLPTLRLCSHSRALVIPYAHTNFLCAALLPRTTRRYIPLSSSATIIAFE